MLSAFVRLPRVEQTATTSMSFLKHLSHQPPQSFTSQKVVASHPRKLKGKGNTKKKGEEGPKKKKGKGPGGNSTRVLVGCPEWVTQPTCTASGCEWTNFGCRTPNRPHTARKLTDQQVAASRPVWATALMVLAIISGAIVLLLAVAVFYRNLRLFRNTPDAADRDTNSSLAPVVDRGNGGGGPLNNAGAACDDDENHHINPNSTNPNSTNRHLTSPLLGGVATGRGSTGIDSIVY